MKCNGIMIQLMKFETRATICLNGFLILILNSLNLNVQVSEMLYLVLEMIVLNILGFVEL